MSILKIIKKVLNVESESDDDDDNNLQQDIDNYSHILSSSKYADSHSNTTALAKLVQAVNIEDGDSRHLSQGDSSSPKEPAPNLVKLLENSSETSRFEEGISSQNRKSFFANFNDRFERHQELLHELEGDSGNLLPGQPFYDRPRFKKKGNTTFNMPQYRIPPDIYTAVKKNDVSRLNLEDALSPTNYAKRFQILLWLEEAHQAIEMRRYDQQDTLLGTYDQNFFLLPVSGLSEGRPSLINGDRIILKSSHRSTAYEGYIHEVRLNDVKIKLHEHLHRQSMDGLKFDVSFVQSRTPFRRCHYGVEQFGKNRSSSRRQVIFPQLVSTAQPMMIIRESKPEELRCFVPELNIHQRKSVFNIIQSIGRPAPYIIFGPCGTGKTVTVVEAVLQLYSRAPNFKILVCANSNACADLLAERIKSFSVVKKDEIVRVSAFYRMENLIPEGLTDITLDMDMITASNYSKFRIVVTTCIQSGCLYEFDDRFDYVFIDEAGHASEPEALIPIGLLKPSGSVILAGDPHQLGPVCISKLAKAQGLGISLLERLFGQTLYQRQSQDSEMLYDERFLTKLMICYRSDPRVVAVNNELFYHNELTFTNKTPKFWLELLGVNSPAVFHGVRGKDRREYVNPSWFNPNEAITCIGYVNKLYGAGLNPDQLGIISPYRRQIEKLKLLFDRCQLKPCKIATMEEFQGDEREVIIISTVRTRAKELEADQRFQLGFLFDPKRFNVAITRAKWLVIVIGDPAILMRDKCWTRFISEAYKISESSLKTHLD